MEMEKEAVKMFLGYFRHSKKPNCQLKLGAVEFVLLLLIHSDADNAVLDSSYSAPTHFYSNCYM